VTIQHNNASPRTDKTLRPATTPRRHHSSCSLPLDRRVSTVPLLSALFPSPRQFHSHLLCSLLRPTVPDTSNLHDYSCHFGATPIRHHISVLRCATPSQSDNTTLVPYSHVASDIAAHPVSTLSDSPAHIPRTPLRRSCSLPYFSTTRVHSGPPEPTDYPCLLCSSPTSRLVTAPFEPADGSLRACPLLFDHPLRRNNASRFQ
jgi:hypothetical protein